MKKENKPVKEVKEHPFFKEHGAKVLVLDDYPTLDITLEDLYRVIKERLMSEGK